MSINNITLLPTPVPSRTDPLNFATRADAFLGALPTFGTELNTFASEANALAVEVDADKEEVNQTLIEVQNLESEMADLYNNTVSISHFKGLWASLTGALNKPASVFHYGDYWLLLNDLADVTTSIPTDFSTDWLRVTNSASSITYNNSVVDLGIDDIQSAIELVVKKYSNIGNRLINPEFMIDQENNGNSVSIPIGSNKYIVDQWFGASLGTIITAQQVAGISDRKNSLRFTGATGNTGLSFGQRMESYNCADLKNKVVTVSLKAKASTTKTVTWTIYYASTTDNFTNGIVVTSGNFNVTTSVNSFNFSFNAGENAGNGLSLKFEIPSLLAGETIEFDQVQLEKSNVPTEFKSRYIQEELALCQRFWEKGLLLYRTTASATASISTQYAVVKRATPTFVLTNTIGGGVTATASVNAVTSGFWLGGTSNGNGYLQANWVADARL